MANTIVFDAMLTCAPPAEGGSGCGPGCFDDGYIEIIAIIAIIGIIILPMACIATNRLYPCAVLVPERNERQQPHVKHFVCTECVVACRCHSHAVSVPLRCRGSAVADPGGPATLPAQRGACRASAGAGESSTSAPKTVRLHRRCGGVPVPWQCRVGAAADM